VYWNIKYTIKYVIHLHELYVILNYKQFKLFELYIYLSIGIQFCIWLYHYNKCIDLRWLCYVFDSIILITYYDWKNLKTFDNFVNDFSSLYDSVTNTNSWIEWYNDMYYFIIRCQAAGGWQLHVDELIYILLIYNK